MNMFNNPDIKREGEGGETEGRHIKGIYALIPIKLDIEC